MALLNYQIFENLADHHAFINQLKLFAETQGWTINQFQQNVEWANQGGGVYNFDPGSESFLDLESVGYGSQGLQYRIRAEGSGSVADHEWVWLGGFLGSVGMPSGPTHPVADGKWNSHQKTSMKSSVIPKTWIFGNDKFIFCALQFANNMVVFFTFGSLELEDSTETGGNFCGYPSTGAGTSQYWFNRNIFCPLDFQGKNVYHDGEERQSVEAKWNISFTSGNTTTVSAFHGGYASLLVPNTYSTVRPMLKQIKYIKDNADAKWFVLGKSWIYRMNVQGLGVGEEIEIAGKKYFTFPNGAVETNHMGVAVRIL